MLMLIKYPRVKDVVYASYCTSRRPQKKNGSITLSAGVRTHTHVDSHGENMPSTFVLLLLYYLPSDNNYR